MKLFNTIQVIDGSDLVKNDIPYIGSSIMFLVSQSGETKDVYRCIDIAKSRNVFTVAVVNEVESVIARNSDCVIDILAGKEKGVASTKTYTNQVVVLTMIAMHMSAFSKDFDKNEVQEYVQNLKTLPRDIRKTFLAMENKMDQVLG
ncbi:MAG: SIS domain-containing protein, partial [bacterium]